MTVSSYKAAGVNVEQGDRFAERIKAMALRRDHNGLLKGAGGFAAVYPVTDDRLIALTTDGVGTKVLLSHKYNQHRGIGIDLVAMCANDLICVGANPTLFLDYFATGMLDLETGTELIEGILDGCDQAGMLLVGGETAEMPDIYNDKQYDLAGFAVGELAPENLITGEKIKPGQKLIGLASTGIHSNGLSLARKLLKKEEEHLSLLEPTRIYVKPVIQAFKDFPDTITGVCHITGGGWRNLLRLNNDIGFEINNPLEILPLFEKMLSLGLAPDEAYKTFNMGMGMVVIASQSVEPLVRHFNKHGVPAGIIGEVTDVSKELRIPSQKICLKHKNERK